MPTVPSVFPLWRIALTAAIAAAFGFVVSIAGFLLGGYQNPLFFAGGLLTAISYPTWAFWLGRVFVSGDWEVRHAPGI